MYTGIVPVVKILEGLGRGNIIPLVDDVDDRFGRLNYGIIGVYEDFNFCICLLFLHGYFLAGNRVCYRMMNFLTPQRISFYDTQPSLPSQLGPIIPRLGKFVKCFCTKNCKKFSWAQFEGVNFPICVHMLAHAHYIRTCVRVYVCAYVRVRACARSRIFFRIYISTLKNIYSKE